MWCLGFKVKDRIRVLGSWLWAVWAIPICSSKTCSFHFPFSLYNPYITHYSSFHFLFHYPCITIYIYMIVGMTYGTSVYSPYSGPGVPRKEGVQRGRTKAVLMLRCLQGTGSGLRVPLWVFPKKAALIAFDIKIPHDKSIQFRV